MYASKLNGTKLHVCYHLNLFVHNSIDISKFNINDCTK